MRRKTKTLADARYGSYQFEKASQMRRLGTASAAMITNEEAFMRLRSDATLSNVEFANCVFELEEFQAAFRDACRQAFSAVQQPQVRDDLAQDASLQILTYLRGNRGGDYRPATGKPF